MKLRIGSRKSDLAQIQSRLVASALRSIDPTLEIEFVFKDVGVDLNLGISLVEAESKGLFTKDLSEDLVRGKIDLVVHSWKDLPTAGNSQTFVAATLEREDPRDVVFIKKASLTKRELVFLSSSPRRAFNIHPFLQEYVLAGSAEKPSIRFESVRGNLPTRLRRFSAGPEDALVLALAAVKRLSDFGTADSHAALAEAHALSELVVVPVLANPPAPAQGAVAIEVMRTHTAAIKLLERINHAPTFRDVCAERARLEDFGGGCHLALGIFHRTTDRGTLLVEKGLTPEGGKLSAQVWSPLLSPPTVPGEKFFDASTLELFKRQPIKLAKPSSPGGVLFFVSKVSALPTDWKLEPKDRLWAAGLKTWKKLRQLGHWVSGCQEGLGETFFPLPTELWPLARPLKLSHKAAPEKQHPLWATYELVRNEKPLPDLNAYEFFYWPSGSVFRACLAAYPVISEKMHSCGFGNTYDEIARTVPTERLFALDRAPD